MAPAPTLDEGLRGALERAVAPFIRDGPPNGADRAVPRRASDPDTDHSFIMEDESEIEETARLILDQICQ